MRFEATFLIGQVIVLGLQNLSQSRDLIVRNLFRPGKWVLGSLPLVVHWQLTRLVDIVDSKGGPGVGKRIPQLIRGDHIVHGHDLQQVIWDPRLPLLLLRIALVLPIRCNFVLVSFKTLVIRGLRAAHWRSPCILCSLGTLHPIIRLQFVTNTFLQLWMIA